MTLSDESGVFEAGLKKVGATIRRLREERGYTQEAFAFEARIARTFYGRIERGEQNLALKTLFQLAIYLDVDPAELLQEVSSVDLVEANLVAAKGGAKPGPKPPM